MDNGDYHSVTNGHNWWEGREGSPVGRQEKLWSSEGVVWSQRALRKRVRNGTEGVFRGLMIGLAVLAVVEERVEVRLYVSLGGYLA